MIDSTSRFRQRLAALKSGDEQAAYELVTEYGTQVRRVISRRLDRRLRTTFEANDFVQMAWLSFFSHPSKRREFDSPQDLVRFLIAVAGNKLVEQHRRSQGPTYPVTRDCSFDQSPAIAAMEPTPFEVAVSKECWNMLISGRTERDRAIIRMRSAGHTYREIAQELNIHERTARKTVKSLLNELRDFESHSP